MYATSEEITISASCLSRNFEETFALVQEILLEPRWDEKEYDRLKQSLITRLKGREASPTAIASTVYSKLLYGNDHIMGYSSIGTSKTVENISMDDLKAYYDANFSPSIASFHAAGSISQQEVMAQLNKLNWESKDVQLASYALPENTNAGNLYFIDFPGAKQSVIYIGKHAISGVNPEYNELTYANEKLGGGSSGQLFQTLRIEKGYTYGAYAFIPQRTEVSPFTATTSVRANATLPSLEIMKEMIANYGENFTAEDVEVTQTKVLKANTRAFESLGAKLNMLHEISKFGKSPNFMEQEQDELTSMTLEDYKGMISKYLNESKMIYLVVGDGASQLEEVRKLGMGDPIILDIYGDPIAQ